MIVMGRIVLVAVLFCVIAAPFYLLSSWGRDGGQGASRESVEDTVGAVLRRNPEIIVEALQTLRQRPPSGAEQLRNTVLAHGDALFNDPADPVAGNANGSVTIVEFFDYRCPYCKQVAGIVTDVLAADKDVRLVFKEFPILGEDSVDAARAALAAHRQGGYARFHAALMNSKGVLSLGRIFALAHEIGLDTDRLRADMDAPEILDALRANHALARALNIQGTPAFVIGDQLVPGAVSAETLRGLIARARQG